MQELEQQLMKIGEKVYAAQQQAGAAGANPGAGNPPPQGGAKNDDGFVDAEVVDDNK